MSLVVLDDEDTILAGLPCDFCGWDHNGKGELDIDPQQHPRARLKCGNCRCTFYCSTECQASDWSPMEFAPNESMVDAASLNYRRHQDDCAAYAKFAIQEYQVGIVPSRWEDLNPNVPCGLCHQTNGEEDSTNMLLMIHTPCGHSFCFPCLQGHVDRQRQEAWLERNNRENNSINSNINNNSNNEPEENAECDGSCPSCRAILLTGDCSRRGVALLWDRRARACLRQAAATTDDESQRAAWEGAAVREWQNLVAAYERMLRDPQLHNEEEDRTPVPWDLYWDAILQVAGLEVQREPQKVLEYLERRLDVECSAYAKELMLWLGDFQQQQVVGSNSEDDDTTEEEHTYNMSPIDEAEGLRIKKIIRTVQRDGLTFEILYSYEGAGLDVDYNKALRSRVVQLRLLQVRAHAQLGDFVRAEQVLEKDISKYLDGLPVTEWAAVSMERALCAMKCQKWADAAHWSREAMQRCRAGRRVPGHHRSWGRALREMGRVEEAMDVVKRGIVYEAPWDTRNKQENWAAYEELAKEVEERAEARRKREAFMTVWGQVLGTVQGKIEDKDSPISWQSIKEKDWDMFGDDENDKDMDMDDSLPAYGEEETALKVQAATRAVLAAGAVEESEHSEVAWTQTAAARELASVEYGPEEPCIKAYIDIKLTKGALKDIAKLDTVTRENAVRKLNDLAHGRGGMTTRKALVGCKNMRIFETYVNNTGAGERILWTELGENSICVWSVPRHKNVSKMMKKIDEADERSERRLTSAAADLSETTKMTIDAHKKTIGDDRVFLDPFSDTPLKVYAIPREEVLKLVSPKWTPRLHLTRQERDIVQTEGTVLLLGRSGTGKTVCICERIARDRHHADINIQFKQLFVARSKRICGIVKDLVGTEYEKNEHLRQPDFLTFKDLLNKCMHNLPGAVPRAFDGASKVDFQRFKRDFKDFIEKSELDGLVIWTQIRSFIKGSVEALIKPVTKVVTLSEYLDFGISRCRLPKPERKKAYEVFEKYEKEKGRMNLWDDCDLMTAIHSKMDEAIRNSGFMEELYYDKLYVDEIQDYTQSEIALFLRLSKPGSFFFAGDAAQAVVEGVEFRFEEIRSTVYAMMRDEDKEDNAKKAKIMPDKPLKVTVNFRSHSGILDVAAAVLDVLFGSFPSSAPDLGRDFGVFQGPRPGFFENVTEEQLKELVSKIDGVHILTRLENDVPRLQKIVGDKMFVLSISDAKGLEWPSVILVDFFKGLETNMQKPWREMLRLQKSGVGDCLTDYQDRYPEIETHLKHLYTAVTRCKERFFIAETGESLAGNQFGKWLMNRDKKLISKQDVAAVEKIVMTADQWATQGLDYAKRGESRSDFDKAIKDLTRAKTCFKNADDAELGQKSECHLESLELRRNIYFGTDTSSLAEVIDDEDTLEQKAVTLMTKLAEENLLVECHRLYSAVEPLLEEFHREMLLETLAPFLPDIEDTE